MVATSVYRRVIHLIQGIIDLANKFQKVHKFQRRGVIKFAVIWTMEEIRLHLLKGYNTQLPHGQ